MQERISTCLQHHATILGWIDEGLSIADMARRLDIPPEAVVYYVRSRQLPYVSPHKKALDALVDKETLAHLLQQGLSHQAIAEQYGVRDHYIGYRAFRWDLETARTGPRSGEKSREWQGGRGLGKHGYIEIQVTLHPHARRPNGRVVEHRLVMEVVLGRYLLPTEVVHHHDNHPRHNWPENLGLFASNADHLRAELTGLPQASQKRSIPGAYGNNQKIARCPDESETLAQCPLEIRQKLAYYIESHRPTLAHQTLSKRQLLRQGAWRDPFPVASTG